MPTPTRERRSASLYDYPAWYDLIFGAEWRDELRFIRNCAARYAQRPVRRMFEPACGTGRLIYRLAVAGYEVAGIDLNPHAVDYCNRRFERRGREPVALVADMTSFQLRPRADLAFNLINSFRHLLSEAAAEAHLACMAASVAPGGLYLLGLHLTPTSVKPLNDEWNRARRGKMSATTCLRTVERNLTKRYERCEFQIDVRTPKRTVRLDDELRFRTYTAAQMAKLLAKAPDWSVVATYDFHCDIDRPIGVTSSSQDVIYVLRRGTRPRRAK